MVNSGDVLLRRPQHASPVGIRVGGSPSSGNHAQAYCNDADSSGEERTRTPSPSPSPPSSILATVDFDPIVKGLEQLSVRETNEIEIENDYTPGLPILNDLARHFALNALFVDMAWSPKPGNTLTVDSLVAEFKLDRHHQHLLGTMLARLEPDILTRLPTTNEYRGSGEEDLLDLTWKVVATPPSNVNIRQALKELQTELVLEHPALASEVAFLNHVGPQLYGCIRGRANGREILYPSKESAEYRHSLLPFYEQSKRVQEGQVGLLKEVVGQYVLGMAMAAAVNSNLQPTVEPESGVQTPPPTPLLRILEIGANGSCAASVPLLRHLVSVYNNNKSNNNGVFPPGALHRVSYTYSDSSSIALGKAKALLEAEFPSSSSEMKFEFKVLDIEAEPEQGVDNDAGQPQYDIILALNALHGAKFLDDALNHIRRLLKPRSREGAGGMLALGEIFGSSPFLECTLGVGERWWRHADRVRSCGPLLNAKEWETTLQAHGFEHVHAPCSNTGADAEFGVVLAWTS